jgi:HSP20 family protein
MSRELSRWPGSELSGFRKDLDRLFGGFSLEVPFAGEGEWAPVMDVTETENGFVVKTEVPGIDPKQVDVQVTGDVVTVRGERKEEKEEKKENYLRRERVYGSFSRSVRLPAPVDPKGVEARYTAGVLTIRLPKSEESRKRKIEIKAE